MALPTTVAIYLSHTWPGIACQKACKSFVITLYYPDAQNWFWLVALDGSQYSAGRV
jgi:hypothetical protein